MKTLTTTVNARRDIQEALIRSIKLPVIIAVLSISLCSCSHYYYVANTKNVPMLREKNEARVTLSFGEGNESSSIDFQGAYAISDKIGILANFMTANGGTESGQSQNWAKGTCFEGAGGYFKPINTFGIFEVYGGLGTSSQHHQYSTGTADLRFTKVFVQPSFGFTAKWAEAAFSLPVSRVSFNEINDYTHSVDETGLERLALNHTSYIVEPAFTIRGGWKYLKLQFQYVHVLNLTNQSLPFERDKVSLGLYISVARRYGKDFQPK